MITGGSRWVIILHSLTVYSIHSVYYTPLRIVHTLYSSIILHTLNHCTAMLFQQTLKHNGAIGSTLSTLNTFEHIGAMQHTQSNMVMMQYT